MMTKEIALIRWKMWAHNLLDFYSLDELEIGIEKMRRADGAFFALLSGPEVWIFN